MGAIRNQLGIIQFLKMGSLSKTYNLIKKTTTEHDEIGCKLEIIFSKWGFF